MGVPRVSVVMAVRNGERHLEEAVESILAQTLGELELIVIDDGSDDETPGILRRLAERDSRMRVLSQSPRGQVAALNLGWRSARAPIVARMDADDIAAPERLALQAAALGANPELALVGSAVTVIDEHGRSLTTISYPCSPNEVRERLGTSNPFAHPAVTVRRTALERAAGYRAAFAPAEDYDLWLRLGETDELANLEEALLSYRIHGGQLTGSDLEQQVVSVIAARELAALRRAGKDEPALPERIDRPFLAALGIGDDVLALEIARAAATRSDFLIAAGRTDEAVRTIDEARAIVHSRRALGLLDRRAARDSFRTGRRGLASRALFSSLRRDPVALLRATLARLRPTSNHG
jgi:glycosyltransferase involved in cell wall biosynthesis